MSKNRRRKSGMKRAYLKRTVHHYDPNPDSELREAIGLGRDINPIVATPRRARLWLDKHKHTPTMTEPMKERVESWRKHVKPQDGKYQHLLVDIPGVYTLKEVFNRFDDKALYFYIEHDMIVRRIRQSFVVSKDTALHLRANAYKGILWDDEKEKTYALGIIL